MLSGLWNSYKNASELNKTLIGLPVVTLLTAATSLTAIYIDARVKYDNAEQAKKCAAGTAFLTAAQKPAIDKAINEGNLRPGGVEMTVTLRDNTICRLKF